eukprot:gene9048-18738_t
MGIFCKNFPVCLTVAERVLLLLETRNSQEVNLSIAFKITFRKQLIEIKMISTIFIFIAFLVNVSCFASHPRLVRKNQNYALYSSTFAPETSIRSTNDIVKSFFQNEIDAASKDSPLNYEFIATSRASGLSLLKNIKLPGLKDEAWRHNNLRVLFDQNYQRHSNHPILTEEKISKYIDETCKDSCIVFVNGIYNAELSMLKSIPASMSVGSALLLSEVEKQEAMRLLSINRIPDVGELPRSSYASDLLISINMARFLDAAMITVPDQVQMELPIQVLFLSTGTGTGSTSPAVNYPCLLVSLGEGAALTLKQTHATIITSDENGNENGSQSSDLNIGSTQISLARGAVLHHTYVQECSNQTRHLEVVNVDVKGEGRYDMVALQSGALASRVSVHVNLTETGANCTMMGLSIASTGRSQDLHTSIQHLERATNSEQTQRNIVGEKGEAIFKGRIRMPSIAQQSASSQMCRSVLLGSNARLQAMPVLEISADDVTCSHGAAVADLDENSMFYLASPRQLLLGSFALELLKDAVMDEEAMHRVSVALDGMNSSADSKESDAGGSQGFMSI